MNEFEQCIAEWAARYGEAEHERVEWVKRGEHAEAENAALRARVEELTNRRKQWRVTDAELRDPDYMAAYVEDFGVQVDEFVAQLATLTQERDRLKAALEKLQGDFHLTALYAERDVAKKWERRGDMCGYNFFEGKAAGINEVRFLVHGIIREALTPAPPAAASTGERP